MTVEQPLGDPEQDDGTSWPALEDHLVVTVDHTQVNAPGTVVLSCTTITDV